MLVTVIIPTCNRPSLAVEVVRDLTRQSYSSFELMVVDQSDCQSAELQECVDSFPKPARLIHYAVRGLSRARNVGLKAARGEIVLFLEDDLLVDSTDLIASHVEAYLDPSIGGTTGRVIESVNKSARGKVGRMLPLLFVPGGQGDGVDRVYVQTVKGGNMSFRRHLLESIGGFDERFGQPSVYEETDVSLKIRRLGYKLVFVPEAGVTHLSAPYGGVRTDFVAARFRFVAYRDRVLLFRNNYPLWLLPIFLASNTATAVLPLLHGDRAGATLALTGLIEGIRRFGR